MIKLFFVSFPLTVLNIIVHGFVIKLCWAWFVSPVFGFSPIGILQALGLAVFVSLFSTNRSFKSQDELDKASEAYLSQDNTRLSIYNSIIGIGISIFILISAFIYHFLMSY